MEMTKAFLKAGKKLMTQNIPEGWKENYAKQRNDIRFYLEKGAGITSPKVLHNINHLENKTTLQEGKQNRMKLIRDKMEMSRKRKDKQDIDNALLVRRQKPLPKTFRGEKLIYAKDTDPVSRILLN